ncbi:MAG: hypothetical protein LBR84_06855 [Tannerella sp.]|jgi:hypothetical protein|nr:hypothetical protein [Tannerella sp.]
MHLAINGNIAQYQIDIVLNMLRSWDIDAQVEEAVNTVPRGRDTATSLPFSTGMWTDYDINDTMLRARAWGTDKTKLK